MTTKTPVKSLEQSMANSDLFNGCSYNQFLWLVGTDADHPIVPMTRLAILMHIDRRRVARMLEQLKLERGY